MQVDPHKLPSLLDSGQLKPFYYVAGTEPLLVRESAEAIIKTAQQCGFDEIVKSEVGSRSDWDGVFVDAASPSLFSEKRLFDVSMQTNTIDKESSKAVKSYLDQPDPDTIVLVRGKTFVYQHKSAAWFKNLVSNAVVAICEPLPPSQFVNWIADRARSVDLNLSRDVVQELANLTEGNLLAAHQELEKLSLVFLGSNDEIGIESLTKLNWSAGNTFELFNAACQGNIKRLGRTIRSAMHEGTEPLLVIGLIAAQLRRMHSLALGENLRAPRHMQDAVRRIGLTGIEDLLAECTHVDSQRKGILVGDPWQTVQSSLLALAGAKGLPRVEQCVGWHTIDYDA